MYITNLNNNSKNELGRHMRIKNVARLGATSKGWANWARRQVVNKRARANRLYNSLRNFSVQRGVPLAMEHSWHPDAVMAYRALMAVRHAAPELNVKPYMKNVYNRWYKKPRSFHPNGGQNGVNMHFRALRITRGHNSRNPVNYTIRSVHPPIRLLMGRFRISKNGNAWGPGYKDRLFLAR
jgi:hypothetical protein